MLGNGCVLSRHVVDLVRRPRQHPCGESVERCYFAGTSISSGFDKSPDPYELLLALPKCCSMLKLR